MITSLTTLNYQNTINAIRLHTCFMKKKKKTRNRKNKSKKKKKKKAVQPVHRYISVQRKQDK